MIPMTPMDHAIQLAEVDLEAPERSAVRRYGRPPTWAALGEQGGSRAGSSATDLDGLAHQLARAVALGFLQALLACAILRHAERAGDIGAEAQP
jgi:hypothetical protein